MPSADLTGCVVRCALSSQDARAWCEKGFEPTIKSLLTQSELEERKLAKEKSDTARDKSTVESRAGGLAARELWAARKSNLLACVPYYQDSFRERFITISLDETSGQPTQTAIDELRTHLGCAHSTQRLHRGTGSNPISRLASCSLADVAPLLSPLSMSRCLRRVVAATVARA